MPPRLSIFGAGRSLATYSRPSPVRFQPVCLRLASRRGFADETDGKTPTGPNQDVLGHVSEEAADLGNVTGETVPDLGQGTPVQEVCKSASRQINSSLGDLGCGELTPLDPQTGRREQGKGPRGHQRGYQGLIPSYF